MNIRKKSVSVSAISVPSVFTSKKRNYGGRNDCFVMGKNEFLRILQKKEDSVE